MDNNFKAGILYGLGAYGLWGVLPIYWKQIHHVPALEILANRFIWSLVFVFFLIISLHKKDEFITETKNVFSTSKSSIMMILAAIMISFNWGIFIWAVEDGRIMETSLGYYINPMMNVLLGVVFLKERLSKLQWLAVGFACTGIMVMVIRTGYLPWVSIVVPLSFAIYGVLKKFIQISPFSSIMLETLIISPLAIGYLGYLALQGKNAYQLFDSLTIIYLIGAGAVTATPLLLFTACAKRLPLNLVGFLQYLAPTISMIIGIFMYCEVFTPTHAITFTCIWIGVAIFSYTQLKNV